MLAFAVDGDVEWNRSGCLGFRRRAHQEDIGRKRKKADLARECIGPGNFSKVWRLRPRNTRKGETIDEVQGLPDRRIL